MVTEIPYEHVSTDVYGPFNRSEYAHDFSTKQIFTFIFTDRASKLIRVKFTSEELIRIFQEEWLNKHNIPKTLLSDQGKCYIPEVAKN